ncbi:MAG: 3-oxoacyl-ACP reductase, partial [Acidiphilium sp. 21-66-27]
MENRFEGKTAVITGGAAGIGLAAATRIIAEGGNAILWDRSREAIVAAAQDLGPSCSGVSLDVTDLRALERAAAEAVREHGAIDVL